jgi:hypothetical protein
MKLLRFDFPAGFMAWKKSMRMILILPFSGGCGA